MSRLLTVTYGAASYLVFLAAFLYAIGFVGNIAVPRSIDHGVAAPIGQAIVVNVLLLGAFAVQHSVMARPAFKRWWTRYVPRSIERSTFVLLSSLVLFLLFWQWRTMPTVIWDVTWPPGRIVVQALFWLGWAIVLTATFMINHFDLFGLRQVYPAWRGKPYSDIGFRAPLLYRVVRHPIMLGFVIAFWVTPTMAAGHLLFALATTGYILIALQLEERTSRERSAINIAPIGGGYQYSYPGFIVAGPCPTQVRDPHSTIGMEKWPSGQPVEITLTRKAFADLAMRRRNN